MIKAIIFDMDGLMIDSERVTFECYQERLKDMILPDIWGSPNRVLATQ